MNGQDLQLNLASDDRFALSFNAQPQLQLACLVGGSQPEARLDWAHVVLRDSISNTTTGRAESTKSLTDAKLEFALVSDSSLETGQLLQSLPANLTTADHSQQWSSLRVHNISIMEHQTEIRCSAYNEKFIARELALRSASDGSSYNRLPEQMDDFVDSSQKLSTSVRLNIINVPLIELRLEALDVAKRARWELDRDRKHLHERQHGLNRFNLSDSLKQHANIIQQMSLLTVRHGVNYSISCLVRFSNPPLITDSIQWLLNDTYWLDKKSDLVKIIERTQTSHDIGQAQFIERLIVQFSEEAQSMHEIQLKCKARNTIGSSSSNTLRLVVGQIPYCRPSGFDSPNNNNNNNVYDNNSNNNTITTTIAANTNTTNTTTTTTTTTSSSSTTTHLDFTDKDPPVYCPVMSDKVTSTFHWSVVVRSANQEGSVEPVMTLNQSSGFVPLSKLLNLSQTLTFDANLTRLTGDDVGTNNVNKYYNISKITCYASDKFGSNDKDPCVIIIDRLEDLIPNKGKLINNLI